MRTQKLAAAFVVVAIVAGVYRAGILRDFAAPGALAHAMLRLGPWGYVTFVVAYAALQPFGIPGTVFILAAPLIWPWPIAFTLSMMGTMAASIVGFSFARFVARDWVERALGERFKKYDEALAARGFMTVFWLRVIFWMPPPLHAFFGVSKVRFSTHFWGSLAAYALPIFLVSYFGQKLFDAMTSALPRGGLAAAVALALLALLAWAVQRYLTRAQHLRRHD